jgi:cytochrome c oxidase subunit 2
VIALEPDDYDAWVDHQLEAAEAPPSGPAAEGLEVFKTKCSSCHLVEGVNDEGEGAFPGEASQVSGVAPNLTHLMTRGAFAGAIFDLWRDQDGDGIVEYDEIGKELNTPALEAWLRDPPGQKPMAPPTRGMPNLELTEDEIDKLVAFLETLQ